MRSALGRVVLVLLACVPALASAQPGPALTAREVMDAVVETYRSAPTAERLFIRVRSMQALAPEVDRSVRALARSIALPSRERRGSITLRLDPARGSARFDLADLQIVAEGGRVLAANRLERSLYAETEYEGDLTPEVLARHFPPLPAPQFAFAFGSERDPTPYTTGVEWESVEVPHAGAREVTLAGRSREGTVVMGIDPRTNRIRFFGAEFESDGRRVMLEITVSPLGNGETEPPALVTAGRQRVESPSQLRPREGEVRIGERAPNFAMMTTEFQSWSAVEALEEARRALFPGLRGPSALIYVMYRAAEPGERAEAIRADAMTGRQALDLLRRRLRREAIDDPEGTPNPLSYGLVVFEMSRFSRESPAAEWAYWRSSPAADERVPALLWSTSASTTIDRVAPGASSAIVVLSTDLVLRALVPLDGRAGDAEAIVEEIRQALAWDAAATGR